MSRRLASFLALTVVVALATRYGGWWMVPVAALAAGAWRWRDRRHALDAGLAAAAAWGALLLFVALRGDIGPVGRDVGGVVGVPAFALVLLTLLFPFALGWSAARVGGALGRLVSRARGSTPAGDETGRGEIPAARPDLPRAERVGAD
jgi:hypothetical protein